MPYLTVFAPRAASRITVALLALMVAACQPQSLGTFGQNSTQPVISGENAPETSTKPVVEGPKYPKTTDSEAAADAATTTGAGNAPASDWEAALAPYLNRPSSETTDNQQVHLKPPVMQYDGNAIRVGLLLPLSGRYGRLGRAMRDAALLALFDFGDKRFELLPHDTHGAPAEASYAANIAVGDGAQLIVGPLLGPAVRAVAPTARAAGVPVIGFSNDRAVAGDGVYTLGFLPGDEVKRVVSYAVSQGLRRFAVIAPDDTYGATIAGALRDAAARYGGTVVDTAYFDPSGDNLDPVIRKLANYDERRQALLKMRDDLKDKEDELSVKTLKRLDNLETLGDLPYDSLLIADGGSRLQRLAALLPFYDIDPRKVHILGTGQWDVMSSGATGEINDGTSVARLGAEPALLGGWFAAPDPAKRQRFVERFTATFGYRPPRLATLSYDAMALAAVLARNGATKPYTTAALTTPSGFAGRDGIFRLMPDGTTQRGLAVLQVRPHGSRVIDRAPTSFTALTN